MRHVLSILILLLGISVFANQSLPEVMPSSRHFIIFVHGIGGNSESFGAMPAALVSHLDERKPQVSHLAYTFTYPTENPKLTTDDFAISLGQFLKNTVGRLYSTDKISFVAHSQGGLVATIWYFHASLGKAKFNPEYAKHIENFVTLGTPFWGSKVASVLISDNLPDFLKAKIEKISRGGRAQLEEMAVGSRTNINFRRNVLQTRQSEFVEMFHRIRPLNIAGIANISELVEANLPPAAPLLEVFKPLLFGGRHFESDMMVSIPSARFDSIYSQDIREDYVENTIDGANGHPITTNYSPFLIVKSIHASPMAESVYDLSFLPSKCMNISACDHPTYLHILRHFMGAEPSVAVANVSIKELGGVSLSFRVDLDESFDAEKTPVKIELVTVENSQAVNFVLQPKGEVMASYEFVHPTKKFIFEKFYSGYLEYKKLSGPEYEKARWQGVKAWFKISAPGHKSKIIETLIRPTYSTFAEVKLSRKLPEMRATRAGHY